MISLSLWGVVKELVQRNCSQQTIYNSYFEERIWTEIYSNFMQTPEIINTTIPTNLELLTRTRIVFHTSGINNYQQSWPIGICRICHAESSIIKFTLLKLTSTILVLFLTRCTRERTTMENSQWHVTLKPPAKNWNLDHGPKNQKPWTPNPKLQTSKLNVK